MSRATRRRTTGALTIVAAIALSTVAVQPAPAIAQPTTPAAVSTVTLPTGDIVHVTSGAHPSVVDVVGTVHNGRTDGFAITGLLDKQYVIPDTARPLVGQVLDLSLFDVAYLAAHPDALSHLDVRLADGVSDVTVPGLTLSGATARLTDPAAFGAALSDAGTSLRGVRRISVHTAEKPAAQPRYEMFTLRIDIVDPADDYTGGFVTLANVDDGTRFAVEIVATSAGTVKVSVPRGRYTLLGNMYSGMDTDRLYMVTVPEFTVDRDTTQKLDVGTANQQVTVDVPRTSLDHQFTGSMIRTDGASHYVSQAWISRSSNDRVPTPETLWVSPTTKAPKVGSLQFRVHDMRLRPTADPVDDYSYDLLFHDEGRIRANQHHTVRAADLARIDSTYRGLAPDGGPSFMWRAMFPTLAGHPMASDLGQTLPTPTRLAAYVTAEPDLRWQQQTQGLYSPGDQVGTAFMSNGPRTYAPGEVTTEHWFQPISYPRPLQTMATSEGDSALSLRCPVCLSGSSLDLLFSADTDDQLDHWGLGPSGTDTWQVYGDDVPLAGGTAEARLDTTVRVPQASQQLRLDYTVTQPESFRFSTATQSEWRFPAARTVALPAGWQCFDGTRECRALPLLTPTFALGVDDITGTISPGAHTGTVTLDHVAGVTTRVRSVTLQLSGDDGATWSDAQVSLTGNTATVHYTVPAAGGYLALRLTATDAQGQYLSQTIHHAMAVGAAA